MAIEPSDVHVFIVEDNLHNYLLITRLLSFMGVKHLEWKRSGQQVLEMASRLPRVDLILLDIHLPHEDGYKVLSKLRGSPRFANTIIVAVTVDASLENMRRAKTAGFDGFIGKPIDADRFLDQIRQILQGGEVWDLGAQGRSVM
ncbi:MAG: response regulator [Anaerolineae bacterium]|nr:MAG: response regulator [Anaerolineae bacterium]